MRLYAASICIVLTLGAQLRAGETRTWTDATGTHSLSAELVGVEGGTVKLRKSDGNEISLSVEKLSRADQDFIAQQQFGVTSNDTTDPVEGTTADAPAPPTGNNRLTTYQDLDILIKSQREATDVVSMINDFLAASGIDEKEKTLARAALPEWQARANKQATRVGSKWMSPAEFEKAEKDEILAIKEAHRLIDIKNFDLARDKFLEASKDNPQGVRADFYLALLNALLAHSPPDAEEHFRECVKRLARDQDLLTGPRRANYIAALNNLAVVEVRRHKYSDAIGLWRKAISIAPFTPELVQNLGLMTEAAFLPKELRTTAGNLYAKVVVDNGLARFDHHAGWLYIPYIDTLDGSMDSKGDEEMVAVAWCTGISLGGDYVLTSRYPLTDADQITVHNGGNVFEAPKGKVAMLNPCSHLAVLRIDGLNGKAMKLNRVAPKPTDDVTIVGYREPSFGGDTLETKTATILEAPNYVVRNLLRVHVTKRLDSDTIVQFPILVDVTPAKQDKEITRWLMHDAIMNAGDEGAPLLDHAGAVVGIHIGNRPGFGIPGSKYSLAESADYALGFLDPIVHKLEVQVGENDNAESFNRDNAKQVANNSIFQLVIQRKAPRLEWSHQIEELHRQQKQGEWTSYQDKTCMLCNGTKQMKCTNRLCSKGTIPKKVKYLASSDSVSGKEVYQTRTEREDCPICHGKGWLPCTNCNNEGIDYMFVDK
jgi:tetratricopeptide (TPR) repeat protein